MVLANERISRLEDRLRQLKAQQARIDARRRSLALQQSRKDDTRRKILVGAVVLARVERQALSESDLRGWLDSALSRDDDRRLFDLTPNKAGDLR